MVGPIGVQHGARERLEQAGHPGRVRALTGWDGAERILGEPVVLEDLDHVFVARDQPGGALVRQRRTVHGGFGAQARVERVRVRLEPRAGEIRSEDGIHTARCTQTTGTRSRRAFWTRLPTFATTASRSCARSDTSGGSVSIMPSFYPIGGGRAMPWPAPQNRGAERLRRTYRQRVSSDGDPLANRPRTRGAVARQQPTPTRHVRGHFEWLTIPGVSLWL